MLVNGPMRNTNDGGHLQHIAAEKSMFINLISLLRYHGNSTSKKDDLLNIGDSVNVCGRNESYT